MFSTQSSLASSSSTEDALANKPIRQTRRYGGGGGSPFTALAGRYVKSLAFHNATHNGLKFLAGLVVTFDDGSVVTLGAPSTNPSATVDLESDNISRAFASVINGNMFGGGIGLGGLYIETVRGKKVSSRGAGDTPINQPRAWTPITPASSSDPCANFVLVGLTGNSGTAIDGLALYFKDDTLLNQGVTDLTYDSLQFTPATLMNVASATVSNQTETPQSMAISFEETVSSSYTFSTTAGTTMGLTTTFQAGIPFVGSGEVEVSATFSFEVTVGASKTFSRAFSYTANVSVPPGETVTAKATAATYQISGTYRATMARVWAYAGAVTRDITGAISGVSAYDVVVDYSRAASQ